MNEHTRIESTKSFTPPASGDVMLHPRFGRVRLIRESGGDSFWCMTEKNQRISLRPALMKRDPDSAL